MQMIKKVLIVLVLLLLCSCQNRIGNVKPLNNIAKTSISSITITNIKDNTKTELTENDETTFINLLNKIDINSISETYPAIMPEYEVLLIFDSGTYKISLLVDNLIIINDKCYLLNDELNSLFIDFYNSISYFK